jgi:hypothetical protein
LLHLRFVIPSVLLNHRYTGFTSRSSRTLDGVKEILMVIAGPATKSVATAREIPLAIVGPARRSDVTVKAILPAIAGHSDHGLLE